MNIDIDPISNLPSNSYNYVNKVDELLLVKQNELLEV